MSTPICTVKMYQVHQKRLCDNLQLIKLALSYTTRQKPLQLRQTALIINDNTATSPLSHLHTNCKPNLGMTMTSDNEKDASNQEISEKEVQGKKEPEENKTQGSEEKPAESIDDSGPEPQEECTQGKVNPTVDEKKPAEVNPAPAAPAQASPKKKVAEQEAAAVASRLVMHSEHSDEDMDDHDDPHDGDKSSDGKGGKDDFRIPARYTKSGRRRATPFPLKLMKVLSTPEFNEVIAWTSSGRAFNILQPKVFVTKILPEHFKSAKYSSFTRKLHRWGFMRHYRGEEAGAFFHKDFQRDRMDLVEKMTCYKTTPQSNKPAFSPRSMPMSPGGREISMLQLHQGQMMDHGMSMPSQLPGPPFSNMQGHMNPMIQQQQFAMQQQQLQQQQMALMQQQGHPQMSNMQMHPQQQMMMHQQQHPQHQQNMAAQGGSGSGGGGGQAAEGGGGGQRPQELNAAIELEVARRLKERINAAAMSRQALVMMQHGGRGGSPQQQQQPPQSMMMDNRYNPYYQQQGQHPQQQGQQAASMSGQLQSGGQSSNNSSTGQQPHHHQQKSGMGPTAGMGVSTGGGGAFYGGNSGASQHQQQGGGNASYKQPFEPTPINYNAYSDLHGFGSLPPTNSNIQGAKTA